MLRGKRTAETIEPLRDCGREDNSATRLVWPPRAAVEDIAATCTVNGTSLAQRRVKHADPGPSGARRMGAHFGCGAGAPPAVPGGGITFGSPALGAGFSMPGSTSFGWMTPFDRLNFLLKLWAGAPGAALPGTERGAWANAGPATSATPMTNRQSREMIAVMVVKRVHARPVPWVEGSLTSPTAAASTGSRSRTRSEARTGRLGIHGGLQSLYGASTARQHMTRNAIVVKPQPMPHTARICSIMAELSAPAACDPGRRLRPLNHLQPKIASTVGHKSRARGAIAHVWHVLVKAPLAGWIKLRRTRGLAQTRRRRRARPVRSPPDQTKRMRASSSGTPVSFVVHASPAATGKARVSVPVVTISPAASGGLSGSRPAFGRDGAARTAARRGRWPRRHDP